MNLQGSLEIAVVSDVGRVRAHNEDSTACDPSCGIAVLADGMGGYRAGEVASALATTIIFQEIRNAMATLVGGQTNHETGLRFESLVVSDAVSIANKVIRQAARQSPEYQGMGTTVVVLLFYDNIVTVAHVGDSRAYCWRRGELKRLTVDHTVVQQLLNTGRYSPEEARHAANKNIVTKALGLATKLHADLHEYRVRPGDVYLLCSDGLTDLVDEHTITATLDKYAMNLDKAAGRLVSLANTRGGVDNISVILVRIKKAFALPSTWQTKLAEWFTSG